MPPVINVERCTRCGTCADICTMHVFQRATADAPPAIAYPEECWHCTACIMDCPAKAVTLRLPLPYRLLYVDAVPRTPQDKSSHQ